MVLPAPVAHDEVPPREGGWIEQIRLSLQLSKAQGILLHVDRAVPERLGDLVRGLIGEHPDLDVHAVLRDVETVPEGSLMVLLVRSEHADALNMGRPIFERRRLKVVLWCDHETTIALMENAPDFFDWISAHHDCPPGPVAHAVAGLRAATEAGAPGIVWRGPGDAADKERLLGAFSAAFPGEKLTWSDPKRDYEELVAAVKGGSKAWIACRAQAAAHVRRLRWAMAEAKKRGRAIVVTETYPSPGWWPVHGRLMPFEEARRALEEAGSARPGALAALAGLEPEAVELLRALLGKGMQHEALLRRLCETADPGAALARIVYEVGFLRLEEVARVEAPPTLRAFAGEPKVEQLRVLKVAAVEKALARGERVAALDMGLWAASPKAKRFVKDSFEDYAIGYAVEARLRRHLLLAFAPVLWFGLAQMALHVGEVDAARVWFRQSASPLARLNPDLTKTATWLVEREDRRASALQAIIRRHKTRESVQLVLGLLVSLLLGFCIGAAINLGDRGAWQSVGWSIVLVSVFLIPLVPMMTRRWLVPTILAWRAKEVISLRFDDAILRLRRGEYADAARALEESITAEQGKLTEEHPSIRRALRLLARALVKQGEHERADRSLCRAIALEGRIVGVEPWSFRSLIIELAAVLTHIGRARDAEALLRKLLGPDQHTLPRGADASEPPRTLARSGNAEADEYLELFLALPKLPHLSDETRATARRLLAEALLTQGRYEEAEEILEPSVAQADKTLPRDHPEHYRTLAALGRVLALQRRPEQAEGALRRALALAEKHAGKDHPDTGRILADLARVEHGLGRKAAPATARRALAIYEGAQIAEAEKSLVRGDLSPITKAADASAVPG